MPLITVYTPTYNRKDLLLRVYESLTRQTNKDFIWLIVDDGSQEDINSLAEEWKKEAPFEIRYYYKENGGVHTARDAAYRICDTELIFGVDSDDWLVDNAMELIIDCWNNNDHADCIGLIAQSRYEDGTLITTKYPDDIKKSTYQDFKYKYKVAGDMVNIFKTSVMQSTMDAPVFEGEKLVGEDYKSIQLPNKPFILLEEPIKIVEYQSNGYTADVYNCMFRNPRGFREDYRQHIIHGRYFKPVLRGYIGYISCCILLKDGTMFKGIPSKLKMLLMAPIGALGYIGLQRRRKKANQSRIKE